MYKCYCRAYQGVMRVGMNFLSWRKPELLESQKSLSRLPKLIKELGYKSVLLVTDAGITSLGLADELLTGLRDCGIAVVVYDKTVPNPTIGNIEEARELYQANRCEALIAFGGGSSMDCAKGVGARIARPNKTVSQMKGLFKVRKKIPTLFAVPTTAGTGSEATVAAVITDPSTHEKYALSDTVLIPHYAVLDPTLTIGLPPHITATTGMDALTHAVEAYIGRSNTKETRQLGRKAVKLVFENVQRAYANGTDMEARDNMLKAAHYAGVAFTRAYIGYVHAIAHTLGGFYGVPHGLGNAVILPYVLEYYGASAHKPLAELAEVVGIGEASDDMAQKANKFIEAIKRLNADMNIPRTIAGIKDEDIPLMVQRALHEGNPIYPVPKILLKEDLTSIYQMIKE